MESRPTAPSGTSDANALKAYEEVSKSHNAIADFRAKLLGLLPAGTGASAFLLLDHAKTDSGGAKSGAESGLTAGQLAAIGLFGFVVTFGLFMYDLRGIQDCVLLRKRAERLEKRLGIQPGESQFRRSAPRFFGLADEVGAGWIVYTAVLAAWLYVAGSTTIFKGWGAVAVPVAYLAALSAFWPVAARLRRA
jgi:hypothetical protein